MDSYSHSVSWGSLRPAVNDSKALESTWLSSMPSASDMWLWEPAGICWTDGRRRSCLSLKPTCNPAFCAGFFQVYRPSPTPDRHNHAALGQVVPEPTSEHTFPFAQVLHEPPPVFAKRKREPLVQPVCSGCSNSCNYSPAQIRGLKKTPGILPRCSSCLENLQEAYRSDLEAQTKKPRGLGVTDWAQSVNEIVPLPLSLLAEYSSPLVGEL